MLAAAIARILHEPRREPGSLPHLSAPVLATQYLGLYNGLLDSATGKQNESSAGLISTPQPSAIGIPVPDDESALVYRGK